MIVLACAIYVVTSFVYIIIWSVGPISIAGYIELCINCLQLLVYSWNNAHLMYLMSKRHDHEFNQKKNNMICIFLTVLIILIIQIVLLFIIFDL